MRVEWDWWMRSAGFAVVAPVDSVIGLLTMETNHSAEPVSASKAKKPYEKPSFRHEQVFVTTALACGKIHPTQRSCRHGNTRAS